MCESAQLALDAVDFTTIDLILTDLHMPFSGDKAIAQLRDQGIDVPVIFLTGELISDAFRDGLLALGNCRVMNKPFRLKELLETVDEMLN